MFRKLFGKRPEVQKSSGSFDVELVDLGNDPESVSSFIRPTAYDIQRALSDWAWLGLPAAVVIAVSAFGDVFLRIADGSIVMLDTLQGRLTPVAANLDDLASQLREEAGRDRLLLEGLVLGARQRGLLLSEGDCYDFRLPPALGGGMTADDLEVRFFVVKLSIAGQLHRQIHDVPAGTRITGFKYVE